MRRDDLYLNDIEVWKAAKVDCPALRGEVGSILETEFGGLAGDSRN